MAKKPTISPSADDHAPDDAAKRKAPGLGDLPKVSLREALRVPQAITDNYAGDPTAPHDIALALDVSPTSSAWRDLAACAMGYGLTRGGWSAQNIALTDLGRRATAPTEEGADIAAKAEAALKPAVLGGFFRKYNRAKLPPDNIAMNVLQQEFGVTPDRLDIALRVIKDNGQYVGFIRDTKTGPFVAIEDPQPSVVRMPPEPPTEEEAATAPLDIPEPKSEAPVTPLPSAPIVLRVFISHGKNMAIVEQVKDVLGLYDIEFEVAVEEETSAIPVPAKVMSAMRRCQAGIMVVTADQQSSADDGYLINTNVLIEIGAAFVLYDQAVVLLWDKRLKVPSNLQGLYRLEFQGDELSFVTGTKLAKAVKSLRKP